MKKKILVFALFLIFTNDKIFAQDIIIGLNSFYSFPTGSLSDRFLKTYGGSLYFGQTISDDWAWVGKVETFKFTDVNSDKIKIKSTVKLSGGEQDFYFKLPDLKMELNIIGLTAQATYTFLRWKFIETDLTFGFSLYSWKFDRSSYLDTLRIDTGGGKIDAVRLNVPSITQKDLSGGFNFGIDFNFKIVKNFWLNIGGGYKAIIGELWYTQALGLDRVSTFQMLEAKAGLKVKL